MKVGEWNNTHFVSFGQCIAINIELPFSFIELVVKTNICHMGTETEEQNRGLCDFPNISIISLVNIVIWQNNKGRGYITEYSGK